MSLRSSAALVVLGLAVFGCAAPSDEETGSDEGAVKAKIGGTTAADRQGYLKAAKIFDADDAKKLAEKDLLNGPKNELGLTFNKEVSCTFHELKSKADLPGGKTPKFECDLPDGTTVKVKYSGLGRPLTMTNIADPGLAGDTDDNSEIYVEVMASRLMWSLGYPADGVYPVRVNCTNCPVDPWEEYLNFPSKTERAARRFNFAVIELKAAGKKIEQVIGTEKKVDKDTGKVKEEEVTLDGQGWAWDEVDRLRKGEPEWDALRLLAAFMTHGDNKAANQRLICPLDAISAEGKCTAPVLVVQDVGAGFGGTGFLGLGYKKGDLGKWSGASLWANQKACQAKLSSIHQLKDPKVTEAARKLLTARMATLSPEQIATIFKASRIEERQDHTTVAAWVAAFEKKRTELATPCQ